MLHLTSIVTECADFFFFFYLNVDLRYNALSFIFLQIRELSWLQWHPFSVSSSPLDGKYHLSILIKVLGGWTAKLRDNILSMSETEQQVDFRFQSHPKITASVEGPYGHEMPYHLMYVLHSSVEKYMHPTSFSYSSFMSALVLFYYKNAPVV